MKLLHALCSTILLLITWLVIDAQIVSQQPQSETTGKVSGVILDRGDARVPKAKIIVERKGFRSELISEDDGRYEIELPVGSYTITVTHVGFHASQNTDVEIRSNSQTTFNVVMKENVFDENLVPLQEIELPATEIPKTYIQLKRTKPNQ